MINFPNFRNWKNFKWNEVVILALGFFSVGVIAITIIGLIAKLFM